MTEAQPYSLHDTPDGFMICGPHAQTVEENMAGGTVSSIYCLIQGRRACLIDSGRFDRCHDLLATELRKRNLELDYIVLTHDHYDHVGNAERLRVEFGGKIVAHVLDSHLLADPLLPYNSGKMLSIYGESCENAFEDIGISLQKKEDIFKITEKYFSVCVNPDILIDRDTVLDFEGIELQLLHTPGHSPGSLCVYVPYSRSLYTGDLTFWVNPCRPYPIGNSAQCRKSLCRVRQMNPVWLGPGHNGAILAPLPWLDELLDRHRTLEEDILRTLVCPMTLAELRFLIFPDDPLDSFAPIPENSIQAVLSNLLLRSKVRRHVRDTDVLWKAL